MRRKNLLFVALLFCQIFIFQQIFSQCLGPGRYYEKIFTSKNTQNITYGNAVKFDGVPVDLKLNFYEPVEDTVFDKRPLLIFAFGGSFTSGFRISPDIVRLCNEFAQRGYVCASIDYRLGFEDGNDSDTNQFKALMRGVQDMKASVRYFYKDAQTNNVYRLDTNKIFIGGVSAGAFIALNYAYGKTDTLSFPAPDFALQALDEVGGPEGNSGNPGYSTKVSGVIDLCGAIADTVWIMPNDPPLCGVHGTMDDLVACQFDSAKAAQTVESRLFGGCDIKKRLSGFNTRSTMYLFENAGHVPFILPCVLNPPCSYYMDTTVWVIRDFLYNQMCFRGLDVQDEKMDFTVNVFPNPSEDLITFSTNYNSNLALSIYSVDGRLVHEKQIAANAATSVSKNDLQAGIFFYSLSDSKTTERLKTGKLIFK
jgi:para-nitrobenzyl esterase